MPPRRAIRQDFANAFLEAAAASGDAKAVKALIAAGADVNAKNLDGETPLLGAVALGRAEAVKALIDAGADVNAKGEDGYTPLHFAAACGHIEAAKELIDGGADIHARNDYGRTPLFDAVGETALETGGEVNTEIAKALIAAGADVDAMDIIGETPLHVAAYWGRADTVKTLLDAGAHVDPKTEEGYTPFETALGEEHEEAARALLDAGAARRFQFPDGRARISVTEHEIVIESNDADDAETAELEELVRGILGAFTEDSRPKVVPASTDFYVYENKSARRARIHKANCGHCNHGEGAYRRRKSSRPNRNVHWHGPYDARESAFSAMDALGAKDVGACSACKP